MPITAYHAKYFAHELTKRSASDSVQKLASTLLDAQVDLNPHQVEAALFAFRSPLSKGAILADEVGLGKTIEAGLVISQKWAEHKRKILIITPANLRKQWSQELKDKFFLSSIILETKSFNYVIKSGNLNPFNQTEIIICSYNFASAKAAYLKNVSWDLCVIDEAHRLRNVYKTGNKTARNIKDALQEAPKILLTATPLQNNLVELYGLVSIIDDYTFGDLKSFKAQYSRITGSADTETFLELQSRLKPICIRTLRRQVLQYVPYTNRKALVEEFFPTEEEQLLYDSVTDYLQSDNLYALPASQRSLMTLLLRRLLASSSFAISGTLEGLAKKLEAIEAEHIQSNLEDVFQENYENYDELKDDWENEDNEDDDTKPQREYSSDDLENIKKEIVALRKFEALAKSIIKNTKGEKLFTALENGFTELENLNAARKAIIFTESTRTQKYLLDILTERAPDYKIVLFNGSNSDVSSRKIYTDWVAKYKDTDRMTGPKSADMRAALVDYFRDEATIMIATEAAAEGINLQFCSLVVNYDMPWNPQRIEQRIGRCHRYGQKHDVVVVNFLNKANAADVRVYELLNDKFQLFDGVFGASDEVLGSIENGVDFEKRIADIYQKCRTREQIDSAFNQLQTDLFENISTAMQRTRQQLLENFDEEVNDKLRINLKESNEYLSKYETWLWDITQFYLAESADFSETEHAFTLKNNPFNDSTIHTGPYRIGKYIENTKENVYRIGHPIAQNIIEDCKKNTLVQAELIFDYSNAGKKITTLEGLVGQSGWLQIKQVSISSFETEDYILLAACTDDSEILSTEKCQRLFSVNAQTQPSSEILIEQFRDIFEQTYSTQFNNIVVQNSERNNIYFDDEMNKLEKWSDDMRNAIRNEIKELDKDIKSRKTEARKQNNLELKIKEQRVIKQLEKTLAEKRYNQYKYEDEVESKKESLLDDVEKRLKQQTSEVILFTVRWNVI